MADRRMTASDLAAMCLGGAVGTALACVGVWTYLWRKTQRALR